MDDAGRHGHERPCRRCHPLDVGADPERQLALEDVEGIEMLAVDVRIGAALASFVACPRDVEQLVGEEDSQRALWLLDDQLTLAGR